MDHTYWLRQTDKPLFEDILWSRPESKAGAGKLLIIGGNSHGFSAAGIAYGAAIRAGAGVIRVILPDAVKKIVKGLLPDADFAPSTPSGSFSKKALAELLDAAQWSDMVLIAGDIGRNSETAILLESFVEKYNGPLTITQDAVDYFKDIPLSLVDRQYTAIVLSMSQLQKVFIGTPTITPITLSMSAQQLAEALHVYTTEHCATIVTKHNDLLFVGSRGQVSTTKYDEHVWRVEKAAIASVFWMQNPSKPFESITTSFVA